MTVKSKISSAQLAEHNNPKNAWLAVNGNVYDFTKFAPSHPGGSDIIYRYAGKDASQEYNKVHAPTLVQKTLKGKHVGTIDSVASPEAPPDVTTVAKNKDDLATTLAAMLNLDDFERSASKVLAAKAWAFVNGGSNDNITLSLNRSMLNRILLRPAVFRKVGDISTKTTIFGCDLAFPAYIAPMGSTLVVNREAEIAQTKGAAAAGVLQCISTAASYPLEDILEATPEHAWFQLYINKDRKISEELVRNVSKQGKVKALFVTVDLPVISKREGDERVKMETEGFANPNIALDKQSQGLARMVSSWFDSNLSWDDIQWLRGLTHLPIVVKGIQRYEDAKLAMEYGCDGIVVSNHGGRAADGSPASILTLLEIRKRCPEVFSKMKVLIDGGFRRGSDVVKALCLGASAVGFGRPFMYALQHEQAGVERVFAIIRDEIETAMRLCGMTDIVRDPSLKYINTRDLDHLIQDSDRDAPLSKL